MTTDTKPKMAAAPSTKPKPAMVDSLRMFSTGLLIATVAAWVTIMAWTPDLLSEDSEMAMKAWATLNSAWPVLLGVTLVTIALERMVLALKN